MENAPLCIVFYLRVDQLRVQDYTQSLLNLLCETDPWEYLGILQEELDGVTGERDVWVYLLDLLV